MMKHKQCLFRNSLIHRLLIFTKHYGTFIAKYHHVVLQAFLQKGCGRFKPGEAGRELFRLDLDPAQDAQSATEIASRSLSENSKGSLPILGQAPSSFRLRTELETR
jgi:hypothetical protein